MEALKLDIEAIKRVVDNLVNHDEVANALWLLDKGIPARYREFPVPELLELKNEIMKRVATPSFYAHSVGESFIEDEHKNAHNMLRGLVILQIVKRLNENNLKPHIYDHGPGTHWLPRMLLYHNLSFSYEPIYINTPSYDKFKPHFESVLQKSHKDVQPSIWVATEIIEHLWREDEIRFEMQRHAGLVDIVEISTPCHHFDTGKTDWKSSGDLGHLRGYTTKEFFDTVSKMFPEYKQVNIISQILHSHLINKNTKFKAVKDISIELK